MRLPLPTSDGHWASFYNRIRPTDVGGDLNRHLSKFFDHNPTDSQVVAWRSGNVVGRINKVTLRPDRLVLGWVTACGRANYHSISPSYPGQLSLLPSAGREMSTSQKCGNAPCDWGVKAGVAHST